MIEFVKQNIGAIREIGFTGGCIIAIIYLNGKIEDLELLNATLREDHQNLINMLIQQYGLPLTL